MNSLMLVVVAIGLALDRFYSLASLPVSMALFFAMLFLAWILGVRLLHTPGVAAEVVMIVQDQNTRIAASRIAVEIRGGKPADAAADHDEIVAFLANGIERECLAFARKFVTSKRAGMVAA